MQENKPAIPTVEQQQQDTAAPAAQTVKPTAPAAPAPATNLQPAVGEAHMPNQLPSTIAPAGTKWDTASAGRDGQPNIETATVNGTQYWRSDNGAASKALNQQPGAARGLPTAQQLADWRMRQDAVNQYGGVGGYRNVRDNFYAVRGNNGGGYVIQGSEADAARFGAPVFNSAHRVQDGPNETFLRYRAEERAARARPEKPQLDMTLPGNLRRTKYTADMQAYNNELNQGFGLDAKQMENALQRQRLAQEYGVNMAQLGNDDMRTQAALGLSGLQQQQAQNQMAWDAEKLKAYQRMNDPRLSPSERVAARRTFEALNGGKENERKPERAMMELPDGTKAPIQYNDDGTYTRMTEAQTGGDNRDYSLSDKEKKAIAKRIPDNMKAAFERDPEGFMRHYAAITGL